MEYKEFLTKLGETALRYAELPEGSKDISEEINEANGIGKNAVQMLQFDSNGDWTYSTSFTSPLILV